MFLKIELGILFVLVWIIAHGDAFLGENPPAWRWPRPPAGAPEWDTDFNGKCHLFFTWVATIMDIGIAVFVIKWLTK